MEFLNKKDGKVTFLLLIAILVIIVALGAYCYSILNSTEPTRPSKDEENTVIEESNTSAEVTNTSTSRSELKPVEDMSSEMFSYEFLKLENEDAKKTNIIYSPLSIKCAMGLLEEGAEGETKAQIDKILGEKGARVYNNIDGVLSTANAVVIRDKFEEKVLNTYR